ncbi:MAG: 30S ribosomal protein S14 [Methanomicrobiaceae archaeon]|nr:30S ribosomal protein S14 [Methanomicrobiaceae archaeon]
MAGEQTGNETQKSTRKFGRGAHECQMCGRKQGLVRRYNIFLCRQCFREWARKIGFKKMD